SERNRMLMANTLFIGKNLIQLDSIDSTNNFAKDLLAKSAPIEGTAILAAAQFAGRGQMGNTWQSEPGQNLTTSFILRPGFLEADKQFFLNMAIALAVKDFCEYILSDEIKIKWPNDIYHHNKKLSGILIENTIQGSKISASVAGIGINVNQEEFDPALPNPVSLKTIAGRAFNVRALFDEFCPFLEKYYLQLKQMHFNFLDKAYTEALYRYQQTHEFKKGEQVFKGEINGVSKEGKLIIHSGNKELRFGFKEVEFLI
ncbi:MAG TPA: biotin--[acetyl-CoA-carboxylase] ligase, partial [Chitinophagales bacterium]|nr:biotin--[acetyl-CoA-carboxylase] ligase [Chitinophagales bacterium]